MRKRTFEIKGIGFPNKGAELMLLAIKRKLEERYGSDFELTIDSSLHHATSRDLKRYDAIRKIDSLMGRIPVTPILSAFPDTLRERLFNCKVESEVDVVLDASGFAYGDYWGFKKTRFKLSRKVLSWKRSGKKIILLPQAFGPFEDKRFGKELSQLAETADLVFARDKRSFASLQPWFEGKPSPLRMAPDFTNLLDTEKVDGYGARIAVIPNRRMIPAHNRGNDHPYLRALENLVERLQKRGESCFVLIHEGKGDLAIGKALAERSGIEIEMPSSALDVKSVIGSCRGVVSSRFHGIVSALSQGVPCIGAGWSHKYAELYEDYGFTEGLIESFEQTEELERTCSILSDESTRSRVVSNLRNRAENLKEASRQMWEQVFEIVDTSR